MPNCACGMPRGPRRRRGAGAAYDRSVTTSGHARRDRDRLPGRPPGLAAVPGLARACHPGPTAAVTVLVTALAAAAGRDAAGCGLVAAAVLAGQLSIGWCNDAVDAGRDVAAGRTGKPVADGTVSVRAVWTAAAAALALCVPLSLASAWRPGPSTSPVSPPPGPTT